MTRTRVLIFLIILVLLTSCSKASNEKPTTDEEVPNMVIASAAYTFADESNNTVNVKASSITVYDDKTVFEDVSLTQEDIEASAKTAEVVDNSQISLSGGIEVKSISDDASITCESLEWDNSEKTIQTDGTVVIEYQDGSHVNAQKFESDIDEGHYVFDGITEAVFVVDDETSFDVECSSFDYNSKSEVLKTGSDFKISEIGKDTILSGTDLEFLKSMSLVNITNGATFSKLEGDGDISVSANSLVYDSDNSCVSIEEDVLFTKALESGEFTCSTGKAVYEIANGTLTIDENAHFTKIVGDGIVECSADSLFYESESKLITISGNICFTKETDQGLLKCTSNTMTFNTDTQILSILGNPQINWGDDEYHASEVIINVETERVDLKGPVTGVIYG